MTVPAGTSTIPRRVDLDWIRVAVFAGLIFYHLGLLYAPWSPSYLKSEFHHPAVEVALLATHPWRMSLLFLISGAATRFIVERRTAGRAGLERSWRLLPPLAFGFLALVPVQAYLWFLEATPYRGDYLPFLRGFLFSPDHALVVGGLRYGLPVYGHLWFVLYLWAYTVALLVGLRFVPGLFRAGERLLERGLTGHRLLAWPLVVLMGLRLTLYPAVGVTLGFVDDGYNHLTSGGMFLLGFLIARSEPVWKTFVELRWPGLVLALVGFVGYAGMALAYGGVPEKLELAHPQMAPFYSLERWGAIVALLGFGRAHLTRGHPVLAYLNGGVFAFYLVHQPAMLILLHWLKPLDIAPLTEVALLTTGTLGACWVVYEAGRRLPWLGPLFGIRPVRRAQRAPASAAIAG